MSALQRLWKDRMDIYRWFEVVENGITKQKEKLMYSGVKCHYSKGSLADVGIDGVPKLINSYTLFCSLDTDLKEGDKVVVTQRNGRQVTLMVGEGFPYSTHQEFSVKREDTA
ncbi:hypothetical protein SAMN02745135_01169 [Caloranaerobacter azorensis DSM 13643]|uniref:Uncharacterized protein n=1 Tax=Caloranaerobacter azorensis DSM 13643 TaxID=1121264 RepID=A0A1M5TWC5_9FIRM|nr:hypothetical protein [Caloranaerobacter azorensis]SHH54961.1 hypothetical protein SAMN02745135_01169 [Caloranaerobacter azorensis DSM 13643]